MAKVYGNISLGN